jgi:hypothetical protein
MISTSDLFFLDLTPDASEEDYAVCRLFLMSPQASKFVIHFGATAMSGGI